METERDTLSRVIEAEKEIQKCLELEKVKAQEWLEKVKKETREQTLEEERKIKEALKQSQTEATKEADRKAAEIVAAAARGAERLAQLDTKKLRAIIDKQLTRILPG